MSYLLSRRLVASILAVAAFSAALIISWSYQPLQRGIYFDNQLYMYAAERVASGVPPHRSLVDHKQALATVLEGQAIAIGRQLGIDDVLAGRALSIAVAAGTAALAATLALRLWGSVAAGFLAGAILLVFVDFWFQAVIGFRPKVFAAFFSTATLWSWSHRRPWLTGVLGAAAYLCWQPAVSTVLSVLVAAALVASARKHAGGLVGGLLLALAIFEGWFWWHGALAEHLFQTYGMPSDLGAYRYPSLSNGLQFFRSMGLPRPRGQAWISLPFLALTAGAALAAAIGLVRGEAARGQGLWRADRIATLGAVVAAVAFTFLDHQAYPDLFVLQPLMAVVLGGALALMLERALPWRALRIAGVLAVAGLAVWFSTQQHSQFAGIGRGLEFQRKSAQLIGVLEEEYGPVWALGCVHLLALERRENFSPFGLFIDPKVRAYAATKGEAGVFDPLRDGRRPGVVLAARGGEGLALPWLARRYDELQVSTLNGMGITVWVLRREFVLAAG